MKHRPFPELADPRYFTGRKLRPYRWKPVAVGGAASPIRREIRTPKDERIVLHELAHVRLTGERNPQKVAQANGVSLDSLQACEDSRIERALRHAGITTPDKSQRNLRDLARAVAEFDNGNYADVLRYLVATYADTLPLWDVVGVPKDVQRRARYVAASLEPPASFQETIRAAYLLDENAESLAELAAYAKLEADMSERKTAKERKHGSAIDVRGPIHYVRPKLSERHVPAQRLARKRRAVTEGAIPRNLHRACIDGAIFSRSTRRLGGTYIVDCSGSMSWSFEALQALLDEAPAATVLTYQAGDYGGGEVRVIAARGFRVARGATLTEGCGGNVVDLAALDYAVHNFRPPFTWIGDGHVGRGIEPDTFEALSTRQHSLRCTELCREHGIVRVAEIGGAPVTSGVTPGAERHKL